MNKQLIRNSEPDCLYTDNVVEAQAIAANDKNKITSSLGIHRLWKRYRVFSLTSTTNDDKKGTTLISISRKGAPVLSACLANTPLSRLKGLYAFPISERPEALVLWPCSAVHTFGFNHFIDVVFLDKQGIVLDCVLMKPNSARFCRGAKSVVELASGTIQRLQLQPGQQLNFDTSGDIP